ncbi:MAG: hypothetical protein HC842_07900 [Cytophagales bacterium]|nr:hypothetical protein [Cytophagales bacterium]
MELTAKDEKALKTQLFNLAILENWSIKSFTQVENNLEYVFEQLTK